MKIRAEVKTITPRFRHSYPMFEAAAPYESYLYDFGQAELSI
jgi:hypothetical protein